MGSSIDTEIEQYPSATIFQILFVQKEQSAKFQRDNQPLTSHFWHECGFPEQIIFLARLSPETLVLSQSLTDEQLETHNY